MRVGGGEPVPRHGRVAASVRSTPMLDSAAAPRRGRLQGSSVTAPESKSAPSQR